MNKKSFKIALNMIMRDNEDSIEKCLDSTKGLFDWYIFCDTGSKDDTKKIVAKWCEYHDVSFKIVDYAGYKRFPISYDQMHVVPDENGGVTQKIRKKRVRRKRKPWSDIPQTYWHFGDARQICLNETPNEADYIFWFDTDDILENVQDVIDLADNSYFGDAAMVNIPYHYAQDQHGNNVVLHYRERLIRLKSRKGKRFDVAWRDPVHEYLHHSGISEDNLKVIADDRVKVVHKRTVEHVKRTNRRNSRIMYYQLELSGKNPSDRLLSNIAYDHYEHAEWEESIHFYKRLFDLLEKRKLNHPQKYDWMQRYAKALYEFGQFDRAIEQLDNMILMNPDNPIAYIERAEVAYRRNNDEVCLKYLDIADGKQQKQSMLPVNELDTMVRPWITRANIFSRNGDLRSALDCFSKAMEMVPGDPNIAGYRRQIAYGLSEKNAFDGAFAILEELMNTGEIDKLKHWIGVLPKSILDNANIKANIEQVKQDYIDYKKRKSVKLKGKKDISFYVGGSYEKWTPETVKKTGIGGSEIMVILMAKELQKLGNRVNVYNQCGLLEGNYDGVEYIDFRKYDPAENSDVLIVERMPQFFDKKFAAKRQILHLHDMPAGELPKRFYMLPDALFVMSDYQKEVYKDFYGLPDEQFWVTRNCIDFDIKKAEKKAGKRDPYKMLYASSYDRGLEFTLKCFREIKKKVPEATIDVFYGWVTYDKRMEMLLKQGNPEGQYLKEYKERIQKLLKMDGVNHRGRVDKETLTVSELESSIWAYFTWFSEISCINAMMCQACGAVPITSDWAALQETVQHGWKLTPPAGYQDSFMQEYIDQTVDALKNQEKLEDIRKEMMPWARKKFSAKTLAKEWNKFFDNMQP